jgi:hypothetical protein
MSQEEPILPGSFAFPVLAETSSLQLQLDASRLESWWSDGKSLHPDEHGARYTLGHARGSTP